MISDFPSQHYPVYSLEWYQINVRRTSDDGIDLMNKRYCLLILKVYLIIHLWAPDSSGLGISICHIPIFELYWTIYHSMPIT